MGKRCAELLSETVYGKGAVARHKKQEKSCAYHEYIKAAVKIPLHRRKIHKNYPEDIIANNCKLIAIADDDKKGNDSP